MELTTEQLEAIAQAVAASLKPSEEEPDWIKDIRRISAEEGGRNKKDIEDLVNQRIGEYIMPMVKQSAISVYLDGLEPEYHDTVKAMLKDEYEKNPDGLFRAGQHELTRQMVQNSARWQAYQAKATATTVVTPTPDTPTTPSATSLDKQGEDLSRLLEKAGIKKTGDEVMQIVEGAL